MVTTTRSSEGSNHKGGSTGAGFGSALRLSSGVHSHNIDITVRRREAAAKVTASLPRAWLDEFQTEDELAVLQTMGVLANGSCEMSRRELAERAGVTPHIVQRTVSTAVQLVERSVVAALNVLLNGDLQGTKPLILLVNDHLTLIILRRRVLAQRALWTRSWWEDSRW